MSGGGTRLLDTGLAALEPVVNRYLALDPEGARQLATIQGRVICVDLVGLGVRVYLVPGESGVQLYGDYDGEPDCTLRGSPVALASMGLARRKEDHLFRREVEISGDTRLAEELSRILAGLEVDWEEQLARLVGDPLAHEVGSQVRAAGHWGERTGDILTQNLGEYIKEEGRLVPSRHELAAFLDDVDGLRDDVERLAARVERLARRLGSSAGG